MAGMAECGIRDLWVWQGLGVELSGNIISNYRKKADRITIDKKWQRE